MDVVVDGLSGPLLSASLDVLAARGTVVTVGYSAGREVVVDVTTLIWKAAQIRGFNFLFESLERRALAWQGVSRLLAEERIKPAVANVLAFEETPEALRLLVEDRPSGRVIVRI